MKLLLLLLLPPLCWEDGGDGDVPLAWGNVLEKSSVYQMLK
jgi:hypothetical protein